MSSTSPTSSPSSPRAAGSRTGPGWGGLARRQWFALHQALGLAAATFVVIVAATGVILTFRAAFREPPVRIDPAVVAAEERGSLAPAAIAAVVAAAEAHAGAPATDVTVSRAPEQPWVVWVDDAAETQVYLDRQARVIHTRANEGGWMRLWFKLHTGEILGVAGQALAVASALALLLLTASGLAMIASRRRRPGRARATGVAPSSPPG